MNNIMDVLILITDLIIIVLVSRKVINRIKDDRKAKRELTTLADKYHPEALFTSRTVLNNAFGATHNLLYKDHLLMIDKNHPDQTRIFNNKNLSLVKFSYLKEVTPFFLDHYFRNMFTIKFEYTEDGNTYEILLISAGIHDPLFNKHAKRYCNFAKWIHNNIPAHPENESSDLHK